VVEQMRRKNLPYAFAMIDIDHFKRFNDTFGHQVGDKVLVTVANIIKENIRLNTDIPCRYGGEEIGILFVNTIMKSPDIYEEFIVKIGERIRRAVESYVFTPAGQKVTLTISMGIAVIKNHRYNVQEIVKRADEALYEAKNSGRNCVKIAILS